MIDYIGEAVRPYPDYARYYEYLRAADASTLLQARFTTALQSLLDGLAIRLEGK